MLSSLYTNTRTKACLYILGSLLYEHSPILVIWYLFLKLGVNNRSKEEGKNRKKEGKNMLFLVAHHYRPALDEITPKNILIFEIYISSLQNVQIFFSNMIFRYLAIFDIK